MLACKPKTESSNRPEVVVEYGGGVAGAVFADCRRPVFHRPQCDVHLGAGSRRSTAISGVVCVVCVAVW